MKPAKNQSWAGFSLLELLIALCLGTMLTGAMLQALIGDGQISQRLGRLQRERANQRRTLELVRSDVERSVAVSANPAAETSACGWAGRRPVLHLWLDGGQTISYSVGSAPSAIWRGAVLMRCGPAFNLDGTLSVSGSAQNRVVIDALASPPAPWDGCGALLPGGRELNGSWREGFAACLHPDGQLVALRLYQVLGASPLAAAKPPQRLSSEAIAAPG